MNLLDALLRLPSRLAGAGRNHEGEQFIGEMRLRPLANRAAVLAVYRAVRVDGVRVHSEDTLIGRDEYGRLCLWPVMEELPFVLPHPAVVEEVDQSERVKCVFATGRRDEVAVFREEITVEVDGDRSLIYAHAWGIPGGPFEPRSRCALRPAGD